MGTYWIYPSATGANDGTSLNDAFVSAHSYMSIMANGDIVYVAGSETLSSILVATAGGSSSASFITFIGVNTSGVDDGTLATWNGNGLANVIQFGSFNYFSFRNFEFTNATILIQNQTSVNNRFKNCKFSNGTAGLYRSTNVRYKNCVFQSLTYEANNGGSNHAYIYCKFINVNNAIYSSGNLTVKGCLAYGGVAFIPSSNNYMAIIGNQCDDYSGNLIGNSIANGSILANRFTRVLGTALLMNLDSDNSIYGNNYFWNASGTDIGGTYASNLFDIGENRLTGANSGHGYVDPNNGNYSLVKGEAGVDIPIPVGMMDEADNIFYETQGFMPAPNAVGSGGLMYHPGMNGGVRG